MLGSTPPKKYNPLQNPKCMTDMEVILGEQQGVWVLEKVFRREGAGNNINLSYRTRAQGGCRAGVGVSLALQW